MAAVIGQLMHEVRVPFGVNILWDAMASLALARATGAAFIREVLTGVYESDLGMIAPNIGEIAAYRTAIGADDVALFDNVVAGVQQRDRQPDRGRSRPRRGLPRHGRDPHQRSRGGRSVRDGRPPARPRRPSAETPVIANTGVRADTVGDDPRGRGRRDRRHEPQGRRDHVEPGRPGPGPPASWTRPGRARSAAVGLSSMAARTRVFFATDLHGSSKCFRKFVNAGPAYGADVLVLGGDVAGKALQTIVRRPTAAGTARSSGPTTTSTEGPDLEGLEKLIADHGYYPYRAEPGELDAPPRDGSLDALFVRLMRRAARVVADARRRAAATASARRLFFMLGNDDPAELRPLLDGAPWGTHAEGRIVALDDDHEMISWGYSNITPWHSHREQTEDQLDAAFARHGGAGCATPPAASSTSTCRRYGTGLDDAPRARREPPASRRRSGR